MRYKDKRMKKVLLGMFEHFEQLIENDKTINLVYKYVQVSRGPHLDKLVDYFRDKVELCLKNGTLSLIVATLLKKMTNGFASELILYLRPLLIQLMNMKNRKDLVKAYIELSKDPDLEPLVNYIKTHLEEILSKKEYEYVLYSLVEFEKTKSIDGIVMEFNSLLRNKPEFALEFVNGEGTSRNLQLLFLKCSEPTKLKIKESLEECREIGKSNGETDRGRSLFELVSRYFEK